MKKLNNNTMKSLIGQEYIFLEIVNIGHSYKKGRGGVCGAGQ